MIIQEYKKPYSWTNKKSAKKITVQEKMIEFTCDKCGVQHTRTANHYKKMKQNTTFDKDYCNKCWQKIQNNLPERRRKNSEAQKQRYKDPKEREKTRLASKGNNAGNANAMKRPEVRKKVSESRSELMKDPEFRKKFSQPSIDAWARGCYSVVNDVNCKTKWHTYIHSNGKEYKVQGTWELKFIEWLDTNNLTFQCHRGRIPYIDDNGTVRNYYPDFYIYEWDAYVDPKADHWYKIQYRKFELLKEQHPDKEIRVLTKRKLLELGIKL